VGDLEKLGLFYVTGCVNRHNCRIWETQQPNEIHEYVRGSPNVNVWCGLLYDRVIGPFFWAVRSGRLYYLPHCGIFWHWTSLLSPFLIWASTGGWLEKTGERWTCPPTEFSWLAIVRIVGDLCLRSAREGCFSWTSQPWKGTTAVWLPLLWVRWGQGWWWRKFPFGRVACSEFEVWIFGLPYRDPAHRPVGTCSSLGARAVWRRGGRRSPFL
jgi:hypothetical protein